MTIPRGLQKFKGRILKHRKTGEYVQIVDFVSREPDRHGEFAFRLPRAPSYLAVQLKNREGTIHEISLQHLDQKDWEEVKDPSEEGIALLNLT